MSNSSTTDQAIVYVVEMYNICLYIKDKSIELLF